MSNIGSLKQELGESESLKEVIDALGEVATMQLKETRAGIQHNRAFFEDISKVYHALKLMAAKRKLIEHQPTVKNNSVVSLLLTSNAHFHGGLDSELSQFFMASATKYPGDLIVIGKSGQTYLKSFGFKLPFKSVNLANPAKDTPSIQEVLALTNAVKNYGRVLVYHSKFVTILDQRVEVSDLTESTAETEAAKTELNYIIEPELTKMLSFFEGQMLTSFLQSVFLESDLARVAARMVAMDSAGLNAEKILKDQKNAILKARKNLQNLRILESFIQIRTVVTEVSIYG